MNVSKFFKFIADKRPEYKQKGFEAITGGYTIPVNSDSVIDEENFLVNGVFLQENKDKYTQHVKFYKEFKDSSLYQKYVEFDTRNSYARTYLSDIFDPDVDSDVMVNIIKDFCENDYSFKKPVIKKTPTRRDIDNLRYFVIKDGEKEILSFCHNYLEQTLDDDEYEIIGEVVGLPADEMKDDLLQYADIDYFFDILDKCEDELVLRNPLSRLYEYLMDCFTSVAEYQADLDNQHFSFECDNEGEDCNVIAITCGMPFIRVYTALKYDDTPIRRNQQDRLSDAQYIASEGLYYEYIKSYFESYSIF